MEPVDPMESPVVTADLFVYAVSRIKNWKVPGPDGLYGFWIKKFTSLHNRLCAYFNDVLSGKSNFDAWLMQGKTTLIMKNPKRGEMPSNFRPITCLPTLWKLFSFLVSEIIYRHLEKANLLPSEQKGCRKKCRGTKDHLLVDKLVMNMAKHKKKNLYMAWIDYSKAYDSVPHSWILECLKLYNVHPQICELLNNVMQCWKIQLFCSNSYYGDVRIQRGIYQGDSLSPLLFVMALMPLSTILNSTNKGFVVDKDRLVLNHLLYLDDLKLFARSRSELESLVKTVKLFSDAIHMRFGIEKCATASISRGKLVVSDDLAVTEDTVIPAMNAPDSYKYLGVFELDQLKERLMKDIIIAKYRRRVRKLLKSALNGQNIIAAINMWAMPLMRYSGGVVKWSQVELKQLDISTRKLLALHKCFNFNDDIDRLYVPRFKGGRGLLSVEDTVQHEQLSMQKYLACSTEPLLQLVYQCSQSPAPLESPSKFKTRRKQEHFEAWKAKPLHGQFVREIDGVVDLSQQWKWLMGSNLNKECEGLIMAAQNQAISTNCIKANIFHLPVTAMCRLCGQHVESVDHILSSCSVIAQTHYKWRHDSVARLVHYELAKLGGLQVVDSWWLHNPSPVMESSSMKLLWDFTIQTDRHLSHNRPDIVYISNRHKTAFLIDVAIPGDSRLAHKVNEKRDKYTDLKIEVQRMWNMRAVVMPLVIGTLGSVSVCLAENLHTLNIFYRTLIPKLQKSVLLSSCHILRRFLTEHL